MAKQDADGLPHCAADRHRDTHERYIEERATRDPAFAKALEIERLEARHMAAGDRRDGAECDRIEAELFRLTGDPRWAPYVPDEEE